MLDKDYRHGYTHRVPGRYGNKMEHFGSVAFPVSFHLFLTWSVLSIAADPISDVYVELL